MTSLSSSPRNHLPLTRSDPGPLFLSSSEGITTSSSFLPPMLSIVSFHIGDEANNKDRWSQIMKILLELDVDIIILHELNRRSTAFFDSLMQYSYDKIVPYLRFGTSIHPRTSWEVFYSKFPITCTNYIGLTKKDGISQFRCNVGLSEPIYINAITINPSSHQDIAYIRSLIVKTIDMEVSTLISIRTHQLGLSLRPIRPLDDMWKLYQSNSLTPRIHNPTFWVSGVKPLKMDIISTQFDRGVSAQCSVVKFRRYRKSRTIQAADWNQLYLSSSLSIPSSSPREPTVNFASDETEISENIPSLHLDVSSSFSRQSIDSVFELDQNSNCIVNPNKPKKRFSYCSML